MKTATLDKWSRLALYQEVLVDGRVQCHLCPHNCVIADGKTGICRTRENHGGHLYTRAYGNPCSLAVDPVEKKPLFHFYPGSRIFSLATAGCNFRCLNCQNWQISQASPSQLDHYDLPPEKLVEEAIGRHTEMIAFTYTEPTVFFEYMLDTAKIAHQKGLKTVMISNGYINTCPMQELIPYLDAANIDLKCLDEEVYRKLDGARLQPVLDTLNLLKESGVWLEITNLLIPGYTDGIDQIEKMCKWLVENDFTDTPLHFSRFFPNYKLHDLAPTEEYRLIEAKAIAERTGLKFVYIGNMPEVHGENTYCPSCRKLLVERLGYFISLNKMEAGKCSYCNEKIAGRW
ncbi:AmmeMemoRadiSam system radical SAM enzyme [Parabacteroides sp. FAFU027]|uniref:AmmeMemoRadiSam system radical SAM enzyme n=1 Tax=Parabacteroides sp. FAFU027 TaxID=2922715 RepID=UPI001FAEBC4F|nr:AmmeMemoRadiSam system radical SAM enzyme [Parabacteroides sp. FAFU027]